MNPSFDWPLWLKLGRSVAVLMPRVLSVVYLLDISGAVAVAVAAGAAVAKQARS